MRLLVGAGRLDRTAPIFQRANVLKFTDLVKLKPAVFMYKEYHYMLPENIQRNFVTKDVNHHTPRSKQQLVRSCVSTNVRSMSLCVYGITLWNYSYRTLSNITKTATHPTTQLKRTDEHT